MSNSQLAIQQIQAVVTPMTFSQKLYQLNKLAKLKSWLDKNFEIAG